MGFIFRFIIHVLYFVVGGVYYHRDNSEYTVTYIFGAYKNGARDIDDLTSHIPVRFFVEIIFLTIILQWILPSGFIRNFIYTCFGANRTPSNDDAEVVAFLLSLSICVMRTFVGFVFPKIFSYILFPPKRYTNKDLQKRKIALNILYEGDLFYSYANFKPQHFSELFENISGEPTPDNLKTNEKLRKAVNSIFSDTIQFIVERQAGLDLGRYSRDPMEQRNIYDELQGHRNRLDRFKETRTTMQMKADMEAKDDAIIERQRKLAELEQYIVEEQDRRMIDKMKATAQVQRNELSRLMEEREAIRSKLAQR
jgi:hypothetical protein